MDVKSTEMSHLKIQIGDDEMLRQLIALKREITRLFWAVLAVGIPAVLALIFA